jgi:hypothetical protein
MTLRVASWKGFALLVGPLTLVGCSSPREINHPRTPTEARLYAIGKAYSRASFRLNRAPINFEEIKPDLEEKDVTDDFLLSPNDGEPFVIFWGVEFHKLPPGREDPFVVAAFERRGTRGQRYVLRFPISVVRMSEEKFSKANFPPGQKPPT